MDVARTLVRAALEQRLIACGNILPVVESHYWWQGKIETAAETLALLKTTSSCLKELERLIVEKHPYDTPEFIAFPIQSGNEKYLAWLEKSVGATESQNKIA
jgi:periplasmic divalent cation tolerance protein